MVATKTHLPSGSPRHCAPPLSRSLSPKPWRAETATALQGLRGMLGTLGPGERGPLPFLAGYLVLHESLAAFQSAAHRDDADQVRR